MIHNGGKYFLAINQTEEIAKLAKIVGEGGGEIVKDVTNNVIIIVDNENRDVFNNNLNVVLGADEVKAAKKRKRNDDNNDTPQETKISKKELFSLDRNYIVDDELFLGHNDDNNDCDDTPKGAKKECLDPADFMEWGYIKLCSLLCSPIEGANLSIIHGKSFFNDRFMYLEYIIRRINSKVTLDNIFTSAMYPEVSKLDLDIKKKVISWIQYLFKYKLYTTWPDSKLEIELCKSIQEGGAGIDKNNLVNIQNLHEFIIDANNIEDPIEKLIINWKNSLLLYYEPINFLDHIQSTQKDPRIVQWDLDLENLISVGKNDYEKIDRSITVQKIYSDAFEICKPNHDKPTIPLCMNTVLQKVKEICHIQKFEIDKLTLKKDVVLEYVKSSNSLFKELKVPLLESDKSIVKEVLPFLPCFQMDLQDISERKRLDEHIKKGNTIVLIAPSGSGKTALISRRLGVNPGILFTCSRDKNVNFRGTDYCSMALNIEIESAESTIELYASSRQLIQCNFISRLIYLDMCLELYNTNPKEIPFFSNAKQFLAYAQYNSNSKTAKSIFGHLLKMNFHRYEITGLRKITSDLIENLREKLESTDMFIFAFDEANVFSYKKTDIVSNNGTVKDILTLLHSEITEIRALCGEICDIYCGTIFTSDVVDVIQSNLGKKKDIGHGVFTFFALDTLSMGQSKEMLDLLYNSATLENLFDEEDAKIIFPTRRRVIGLLYEALKVNTKNQSVDLHQLRTPNYPFRSHIVSPLKSSWIDFINEITILVKKRVEQHDISLQLLQEMYVRGLNPQLFPTKSIHVKEKLAAALVGTGLATPTGINGNFFFDCSDPITKHICTTLMLHYFPTTYQNCHIPLEIMKFLLSCEGLQDLKCWGKIFALLLQHYNNKSTSEIQLFSQRYKGVTNFKATHYMDALDFYHLYYNSDWAKKALSDLKSIYIEKNKDVMENPNSEHECMELGDYLYWYCISHVENPSSDQEFSKECKKIVDGLIYLPSNLCHPDSILINIGTNNEHILYLTSNKIHNCSRETYMKELNDGEMSLRYALFYKNNYTKKETATHLPSTLWWESFKLEDFFRKATFYTIIAHIHISPTQLIRDSTRQKYDTTEKILEKEFQDIEMYSDYIYLHLHQLPSMVGEDLFLLLSRYFERSCKFESKTATKSEDQTGRDSIK